MLTRCSRLTNKAMYVQRSVLSHTATKGRDRVKCFKAKICRAHASAIYQLKVIAV